MTGEAIALTHDSMVRKLVELALQYLSLRECHEFAEVALLNPERTTRVMRLRFVGQRVSDEEMVQILRTLKRDLETVGVS